VSRRESMAKFFVKFKSKHDIATYLWNHREMNATCDYFNLTVLSR